MPYFRKIFALAFKRIICKCFCSGKSINLKTSRRGSDMSAIKIRARTPSITPSAAAHSFGDESELHHSEMIQMIDDAHLTHNSSSSNSLGVRKSSLKVPVYEICHPLVMDIGAWQYEWETYAIVAPKGEGGQQCER
ncbi:hypothetical protein DOY81_009453 [Sarcophaga bullata]|nr:hypothetical protein DOY81_009453 [Sarcophaga bullata]